MDNNRIANFIYELGWLRKTARSHRMSLMTDDMSDNIASHSYRVTVIGYLLAKAEGVDADKVLRMCLFHDIAEARAGDQNWVHKKYVKVDEEEITKDQLDKIVPDNEAYEDMLEYEERDSKESIIAKDADLLDQICLLREYEMNGNTEAKRWIDGKEQSNRLKTKTAQLWAEELYTVSPSKWWKSLWTSERK